MNCSELKVYLLRQRTEAASRELERLKRSLEISQREVEERESNQKKSREEETGAHTSEGINI